MAEASRPGGIGRLVYLLDRYGEAIEADLADRQLDLGQLWCARRWRHLLNIIDRLPRTSHLVCAMGDDEELAENTPEPTGSSAPPLTEWSPEVERLTLACDLLNQVVTAVGNTVAKKPRRPPHALPRPETARDRIKRRQRREKHHLLLRRLKQAEAEGRPTMADTRPTDLRYSAAKPKG